VDAGRLGLVGMHAVYWLVTHPVNDFWLEKEKLGRLGSGFFSLGSSGEATHTDPERSIAWTELRDRWEYSHVARAGLGFAGFVALAIAISAPSHT
jgi:hypothetical protein